jgi:hypothetical protein
LRRAVRYLLLRDPSDLQANRDSVTRMRDTLNRVLNLDPSDQTAIRNASDALNHYQEQFEVAASTLPVGQAPADRYPGSGCGHQVLKQIEKRAPEIMDKYGLTLDALIEKHLVSKLQAKEVKVFCNDGKIVESNPYDSHDIQLRALDMAFKLRGSYAPRDPVLAAQIGIKVVVVPRELRPT